MTRIIGNLVSKRRAVTRSWSSTTQALKIPPRAVVKTVTVKKAVKKENT